MIELMPISDRNTYGFKYVNGHPQSTPNGLQTLTAFGLLADVKTGHPMLRTQITLLTALRTTAMLAVTVKYLPLKAAKTMALIGNGT